MEPMRPNRLGQRELNLSAIGSLTQRTQRFSQRSQSQRPRPAFLCVLCVKDSARRVSRGALLSLSLAFMLLLGCDSRNHESPQQRYEAAKALFEQTTRNFHIPSVEAKGAERQKLLEQAAIAYQQLLQKYPEQDYWAAQSLRSLG